MCAYPYPFRAKNAAATPPGPDLSRVPRPLLAAHLSVLRACGRPAGASCNRLRVMQGLGAPRANLLRARCHLARNFREEAGMTREAVGR